MSRFRVGPFEPSQSHSLRGGPGGPGFKQRDSTPAGTLLVGSGDGPQVAVSDDRGQTWQRSDVAGTNIKVIEADPLQSGVIYALFGDGGAQRSQDGGLTWSSRGLLPEQKDWRVLVAGPDGVLYAGGRTPPVWTSDDRGDTWTPLEASLPPTISHLNWQDNSLYVGTDKGLWRWTGIGRWQRILGDEAKAVYSVVVDDTSAFPVAMAESIGFNRNVQVDQLSTISVYHIAKIGDGR